MEIPIQFTKEDIRNFKDEGIETRTIGQLYFVFDCKINNTEKIDSPGTEAVIGHQKVRTNPMIPYRLDLPKS